MRMESNGAGAKLLQSSKKLAAGWEGGSAFAAEARRRRAERAILGNAHGVRYGRPALF